MVVWDSSANEGERPAHDPKLPGPCLVCGESGNFSMDGDILCRDHLPQAPPGWQSANRLRPTELSLLRAGVVLGVVLSAAALLVVMWVFP